MKKSILALSLWITLVTVFSILLIANYVYWHLPATFRLPNIPEPTRFWNELVPFYNGSWYWVSAGILLCLIFILALFYQFYEREEKNNPKEI